MKEKVILFGASKAGELAFDRLKKHYEIVSFVDNDSNKWGKDFYGIKIYSPEILKDYDLKVFITSSYVNEISNQLENMGIVNYCIAPLIGETIGMKYENHIRQAKKRLFDKIMNLNIYNLNISDYNKKYLNDIIEKAHLMLEVYTEILIYLLSNSNIGLDEFKLLDYGGGTGVLSLLAKEAGIGKVFYNDIYNISCNDALNIAKELDYDIEHYIEGDLIEVKSFCYDNNICFDGIVSYDVIEHIYDIEDYFKNIGDICNNNGIILMTTSANSYNQKIVNRLLKHHYNFENNDRKTVYGWKKRDSLPAYKNLRKEIIIDYLNRNNITLDENIIHELVFQTKGKIKNDIDKIVKNYVKNGVMYIRDDNFNSNTCDPLTGNWAEHLIDYEYVKINIQRQGYRVDILPKRNIESSSILSLCLKKQSTRER